MIRSLTGQLEARAADHVIINVSGFGIKVFVPSQTLGEVEDRPDRVVLHTYLHLRGDQFALYGFTSEAQLQLFEQLISVNKVGPKTGLSILSAMSSDEVESAISRGEVEVLASLPGIGRKTAERIVLDLKDKVRHPVETRQQVMGVNNTSIVIDALTSLGFSQSEALAASRSLPAEGELADEEAIRIALEYFQR